MATPAWLHPIWQPPGGKRFDEIWKNHPAKSSSQMQTLKTAAWGRRLQNVLICEILVSKIDLLLGQS